ncbi:DNA polymerase I [Mangrovivirga sp. M17]|uniref:DNA polymerase I n=1 Tax=Mangrovivirga halotolerans TaxID=2993936 RepID=A0ABT3RTH8_9BACT|nr:DNA polymerase I [Mangrovivirga halotolerans]MCX2744654.1 DNA polymerase I [Mangrovivirga halotolerans]
MAENKKTLFLLDAYALIYRAHFAFSKNPRINSKGLNTGVMLGFTNALLEIINKRKPSHIGVAFDPPGPTFRSEVYEEYKANREETPEDIKAGVPWVKKIIESFGIPILEVPKMEADDVIGTLSKKAAKEGFTVYMMTPDKDYSQLVEENIFLYKPAFMGNSVDILGIEEVKKKWDIEHVDQVRDMLGLQGDSVDNIPGIPGIGPKTASKLLKTYGTVENLVKNAEDLKGKQKEKVIEFGPQGILSKELATIKIDCDIDLDPEALEYTGPDEEKLKEVFDELEFRTLLKRVFGEQVKDADSKGQLQMFAQVSEDEAEETTTAQIDTIETVEHEYYTLTEEKEIDRLVKYLKKQKEICYDTETDSIQAFEASLVGLSFSFKESEAYYIPVPEDEKKAEAILSKFKDIFEDDKITKIGQNLKYDILVLKKYGIEVSGPYYDTMLAHYLLEPEQRHNMDVLAENYLNYSPVSIETLIGKKGKKQGNMRDVEIEKVGVYAAEDADITLRLKNKLDKEIRELQMEDLLTDLESPLVEVLAAMEFEGVKVDKEELAISSKEMEKDLLKIQEEIFEIAGEEFNIASPKQLGEILFVKLKVDKKPKKTKTGQFATGEEILSRLANEHEIAQKILDFREIQKLKSTYIDALPELISERDGRIHTSYNQAVAATGRLSSTNPNLQNIPIRTEKGRAIRKAFVPRNEDYTLLAADYSQIELRIMASFSGDKHMIEAFKNGTDIHSATAAKIFKVNVEDVDSDMRRKAKTANFGIIYGISAFGLSQRLNIPRKEAAELIETYFEEFPAVKKYMDDIIDKARENEFVETIKGRRRYLRDINSRNATNRGFAERNAINAPIQGSAADIIKVAMIDIHNWMKEKNLKSKMILQVHDELVFDVHKDELDLIKKEIPKRMMGAADLAVPMEVETGTGNNWLEAH